MNRSTRGFTLIEIMVVIGIIVILAAVLTAGFAVAFSQRDSGIAKSHITTLSSNAESFQNRWGVPPPSSINDLGILARVTELSETNKTNRGIECLILSLRARREGGPYLDKEMFNNDELRDNIDGDEVLPEALTGLDIEGSPELFEFVDPWGNPFVYVRISDVREGNVDETITKADGTQERIDITQLQDALKHPTTGQYPGSFVIWSFGEDGINDYGGNDDITSWEQYDEE